MPLSSSAAASAPSHGSQGVVLELRVPSQLDAAARDRLELHVVAHYPIE